MLNAIKIRKSIRKFRDQKVEPEKINSIIRAAMQAPTAMRGEPWEFVVVDDKKVLKSLEGFSAGAHAMTTAPVAVVPLIKTLPMREEMNLQILDYMDLSAATENLLLQAAEEGLSTCWMGIVPGSDHCELVSKILSLPDDVRPFAVVAVGYPDEGEDLTPADRYDETRIHYNSY